MKELCFVYPSLIVCWLEIMHISGLNWAYTFTSCKNTKIFLTLFAKEKPKQRTLILSVRVIEQKMYCSNKA